MARTRRPNCQRGGGQGATDLSRLEAEPLPPEAPREKQLGPSRHLAWTVDQTRGAGVVVGSAPTLARSSAPSRVARDTRVGWPAGGRGGGP